MLENRYYTIDIFSNEWWMNNIITVVFILIFLYIGKQVYKYEKYHKLFSISIGSFLLIRLLWNQWYQYNITNIKPPCAI